MLVMALALMTVGRQDDEGARALSMWPISHWTAWVKEVKESERSVGKVVPAKLAERLRQLASWSETKTFKFEPFHPQVMISFMGPKTLINVYLDAKSSRLSVVLVKQYKTPKNDAPALSNQWREDIPALVSELKEIR